MYLRFSFDFTLFHTDPLTMPVKSNTSYAQEDLDLINSEILNMDSAAMESPLFAEARTPRSDSCGEACNSRPGSSADSFNPFENSDGTDAGCKMPGYGEDILTNEESPTERMEYETETHGAERPLAREIETKADGMSNESKILEENPGVLKTDSVTPIAKTPEPPPKIVNRGSLKFFPGAKLEAKDFNDKWQVFCNC